MVNNKDVGKPVAEEKISYAISYLYCSYTYNIHTSGAVEVGIWRSSTIRKHAAMKEVTIVMLGNSFLFNLLTSFLLQLKGV